MLPPQAQYSLFILEATRGIELVRYTLARSSSPLIVKMLDDTRWAGVHIFVALSHIGVFFAGTFFFIFSPMSFDVPFEVIATLPWAASAFVSNVDHSCTIRHDHMLIRSCRAYSGQSQTLLFAGVLRW